MFEFLKSFFNTPTFEAGERVNLIRRGSIVRTDGYVIASTKRGVMVEWPRGGTDLVSPNELSVIG